MCVCELGVEDFTVADTDFVYKGNLWHPLAKCKMKA